MISRLLLSFGGIGGRWSCGFCLKIVYNKTKEHFVINTEINTFEY
jgi:hypothetical protein